MQQHQLLSVNLLRLKIDYRHRIKLGLYFLADFLRITFCIRQPDNTIIITNAKNQSSAFAKVERGDVEAFTVVYNKYHKLLYVLAYRYLMDKAMAEDAVQHVFTRFWEFRSELRVGISLKNYLVTMTKNHILNVIRNENNAIAKNYEIAQSIPEYEDTLIENLEKKEMMSLFYKALDKLPPQKREICLMKDLTSWLRCITL